MRSYYSHLESAKKADIDKKQNFNKPTLRSSAIFPVVNQPGVHSRILFLGYWILKRHITQIATVVTLRSDKGTLLHRHHFLITEAKTFRIEVKDLLKEIGYNEQESFQGSLEIEFFSSVNLVFPYPAVVINYYGPQFSSVVHTAQRVYNDFEDYKNNSQTTVPEAGFNIYADDTHEPFIGLVNGPEATEKSTLSIEILNSENESQTYDLPLDVLQPYQLEMIYLARLFDLNSFLKGKVGTGKLKFNLKWIFPRLLVGNFQRKLPAFTITHSYYDCTTALQESDYWMSAKPEWHPASLMIPVYLNDNRFTNIFFYPIYSPSNFIIDIEIYNAKGACLGKREQAAHIHSPMAGFLKIDLQEICKELQIKTGDPLAARIISRQEGTKGIPARIKIGLDIGNKNEPEMPCNICNNLQPFNPSWESKPSAFKWSPILADRPEAILWIANSAPAVSYQRSTELLLTFFREKDAETIIRQITLPANGFVMINPAKDEELNSFFDNQVGWCTIVTSNPYTTSYYFSFDDSGVVGGDHCF